MSVAPPRGAVAIALRALAGTATLATALGFVGLTAAQHAVREPPAWLELSRYLPYYWLAVPALAALAMALWLGRGWVGIGLLPIGVLATASMGLEWHAPASPAGPGQERLRVMSFNAKFQTAVQGRGGARPLAAEVARHRPDLLLLQDADGLLIGRADPALHPAEPLFGLPHVQALGQYVVASRWPLRGCGPGQIGYRGQSHRYLRCTVDLHGTALTLVTAHFESPRTGLMAARHDGVVDGSARWQQNLADRRAQAEALARDLAAMPRPLLLAGDLNADARSPVVRVLREAGLVDAFAAAGRGYGFTYGHSMRAGLSFLRIDHILTSPELGIADAFVGEGAASEHRPVIADLLLRRGGATPGDPH